MPTLKAEFNGTMFVPTETVALPVGTQVEVLVPAATPATARTPTPEDEREWAQIREEISADEPAFATVDEALRHSRARP